MKTATADMVQVVAERLGSEHGAVIDTFLASWLAANIGRIYGPLLALALVLHARNLSKRKHPARRD